MAMGKSCCIGGQGASEAGVAPTGRMGARARGQGSSNRARPPWQLDLDDASCGSVAGATIMVPGGGGGGSAGEFVLPLEVAGADGRLRMRATVFELAAVLALRSHGGQKERGRHNPPVRLE